MMEHRRFTEKRPRRHPLRFQDLVPQPPPPLPLAQPDQPIASPPVSMHADQDQMDSTSGLSLANRIGSRIHRTFTTPRSVFGLSRRYEGTELPSHDPEEQISPQDLSDIPVCNDPTEPKTFYPFPNRTAFRLADWHWNGGVQKSQAGFRDLIDIIGDPEFQPANIQNINWGQIDNKLGTNNDEGEWLDEDAGWMRTPVTISVPYQSRRGVQSASDSGPRNYTVDDFYHRSLVSVI